MISKDEYNKAVARNLRRIMYEKQITQAKMAQDLGIGKSTISTWMNGEHIPRMNKIDMLCRYLNCSRSDLIEVEPNRKTHDVTDDQAELIRLTMTASPENVALVLSLLRKLEGIDPDERK